MGFIIINDDDNTPAGLVGPEGLVDATTGNQVAYNRIAETTNAHGNKVVTNFAGANDPLLPFTNEQWRIY